VARKIITRSRLARQLASDVAYNNVFQPDKNVSGAWTVTSAVDADFDP